MDNRFILWIGLSSGQSYPLFEQPGPGLNNFFLYLQKCILQVQDSRKLPSTVIALVNSLDGLSQEAIHM